MRSVCLSRTGKDGLLLTLLVLAGLGVRLYFLQFYTVISADGISYVTIGREFISGHGLTSATHYPPFYPILLGLAATLFPDFEAAGLAVSIAMGSLVVVPLYLLGSEFFDRNVGFIAAVLAVTWPALRLWSTAVMSQSTYITLLLFGVYFLWQAYKKITLIPALAAGVCFGCAHLTRSEGALVLIAEVCVILVFALAYRFPRRRVLIVLVSVAVFFVVCSPYIVLLHDLTGKWQLTGKSRIAIADTLSTYLKKPDIKHDPAFAELGFLDLIRQHPEYIRTNHLKNLTICWKEMLPPYGWLLAIAGFIVGIQSREKAFERTYLLATFVPLSVIIVFFFIGPEYTQPYLPVLFLFIGNGLNRPLLWLVQRWSAGHDAPVLRYGWLCPVLLVMTYSTWNLVKEIPADRGTPYAATKDGGRFDDKQVGLRLKKILPENAVLMTRSGRIGFYSDRRYVVPPQAGYEELLAYARKHKVDYLIVNMQLVHKRPQLHFLYTPVINPGRAFIPPPELELIFAGQEPGGTPYLVYRFRR